MSISFLNIVSAYCKGEISLDDLRFWIAENIGDLMNSPFSEDIDLVAKIEAIIVEANELGEDDWFIRLKIREALPEPVLAVSGSTPFRTSTSSSNATIGTVENIYTPYTISIIT